MPESPKRLPWWKVLFSYSVFESADSAWSLIIVSSFFPPFLKELAERTGYTGNTTALFGFAITIGALLYVLIAPVLGAALDHSGRRQPYLRWFVPVVVASTAVFAIAGTVGQALAALVIAYVAINAGFSTFNSMMPAVSSPQTLERDMGMTVGIGYVGGLLCLKGLPMILGTEAAGPMFVAMAVVYALFAMPAMFVARDFPPVKRDRFQLGSAYRNVAETFRVARSNKTVFRFLITDFLYENAVASVITLMGVYCTTVMGFKAAELSAVFGPAIIVSALSAFCVFGPLTKKIGPRKTVLIDLSIWLLLFAMALAIRPGTVLHVGSGVVGTKTLFAFAVAPLAGLGLAGVWTASRVYLTAITPAADAGKIWSLYSLSGRSAAVIGDLTWTLIVGAIGETLFGFQMAILALAGYIVLGFISMLFLPDTRAISANFAHGPAPESLATHA